MHYSDDVKIQIKKGRKKFIAMAITYCLGVFNDNFFKGVALLLAVTAGKEWIQSYATILFAIPFVLFSSYAGWLADRYAKKYVVIGTKFLELAAMIVGAVGVLSDNWILILAMVFLMALQSTIFSPALNGSIPELYPKEYVNEANAIMKSTTTIFILFGIATSGYVLDRKWFQTEIEFGRVLVAIVVLTVATIGVIASFGVFKHSPNKKNNPFPWAGPLKSVIDLKEITKDKPLLLALIGSGVFYSISSVAVLIVNEFGLKTFNLSKTVTGLLAVSLMIGICAGSFLAAQISNNKNWTKMPGLSSLGMGIGFILTALSSFLPGNVSLVVVFITLVVTGTFAGMLLIPVVTYIQVKPHADEKGKVLGVENFIDFSGIILTALLYYFLIFLKIKPPISMIIIGTLTIIAGIYFYIETRKKEYKL